jgi:hypothetical protein
MKAPEQIPDVLMKDPDEHEKMAAVPHLVLNNSFDVTQRILRLTHSQLMKMLEDQDKEKTDVIEEEE